MDARLFEILFSARQAVHRLTGFVFLTLAGHSPHQIEHVEFGRRMTQQMGEVPESLRVLQAKGLPAVADGPKLALFAEDPALRCTRTRRRIAGASRAKSSTLRHTCHLNVS